MEQTDKHRLAKVAKELGVGVGTLIEFFEKSGIKDLNPNSKIDQSQYNLALKKFRDEKIIKEKINEQKNVEALNKKNSVKVDDTEKNESEQNTFNVSDNNLSNDKLSKNIKKDKNKVSEKNTILEVPKVIGKIDLEAFDKKKTKNKNIKVIKQNKIQQSEDQIILDVEEKIENKITSDIGNVINNPDNIGVEDENIENFNYNEESEIDENSIENELIHQNENFDEDDDIEDIDDETEDDEEIDDEIDENIEDEEIEIEEDDNLEEENTIKEIKPIEKKKKFSVIKAVKPIIEDEEELPKIVGPKVIGKINLNEMNLKTRPDKKTKKEKEEERKNRNKEKVVTVIKKEVPVKKREIKVIKAGDEVLTNSKRAKRKRIEKVEIKDGKITNPNLTKPKVIKVKRDEPPVINEIDIQKQVRETLQKLEQKQKSQASKFRKEKRKINNEKISDEIRKKEAESQIIKVTEFMTVKELSDLMNIAPNQVIEVCFDLGQPVTINFRLDSELINLILDNFDFKAEFVQSSFEEDIEQDLKSEENRVIIRPPIVTVMGHVDHGKTSLLDKIRQTNVVASESGGITQHIGAYSVKLDDDRIITFIDTPGHEAFTAMRARGTKVTDIAIIIIAADDNIMPQTEEAIDHAKAAGVPMIFAINKIDKPGADAEKIKQQLAQKNLLVESWGGSYGSVEISAKAGIGIEDLLERIWYEAELIDIKGNPNRNAIATVLDAKLDKGRGYITNVIVRTGTLNLGDIVVSGAYYGKVKALFNEFNQRVKSVGPSSPIQLLGLNGAPEPGEPLVVMNSERDAREKADQRLQIVREMEIRARKKHTLEEISRRFAEGEKLDLNIIVKADVKGSVDAITDQLTRLSNEEVNVNVVRSAVGQISDTDVMLAAASNAIVIGFNVRHSDSARKLADNSNIEIRWYSIIYDIINDIKAAVHGMLKPEMKEQIVGTAEVMEVFKVTKVGSIAGCIVRDGKITNNNMVRLIRDGIVVYTGKLKSLKRFKDDAKEVLKGYECGIGIENFNDIKQGDFIESFNQVEVERDL